MMYSMLNERQQTTLLYIIEQGIQNTLTINSDSINLVSVMHKIIINQPFNEEEQHYIKEGAQFLLQIHMKDFFEEQDALKDKVPTLDELDELEVASQYLIDFSKLIKALG